MFREKNIKNSLGLGASSSIWISSVPGAGGSHSGSWLQHSCCSISISFGSSFGIKSPLIDKGIDDVIVGTAGSPMGGWGIIAWFIAIWLIGGWVKSGGVKMGGCPIMGWITDDWHTGGIPTGGGGGGGGIFIGGWTIEGSGTGGCPNEGGIGGWLRGGTGAAFGYKLKSLE